MRGFMRSPWVQWLPVLLHKEMMDGALNRASQLRFRTGNRKF